jgi:hypothetical protein
MDKIIKCYKDCIIYFEDNKEIIVLSKDVNSILIKNLKNKGYKIESNIKNNYIKSEVK